MARTDPAPAIDYRRLGEEAPVDGARRLPRAALHHKLSVTLCDAFPFLGACCNRIAERVLDRLGQLPARVTPHAHPPEGHAR